MQKSHITYVIYAFQSGSFESIKLAVMGHFSLQQIVEAKNELWGNCILNALVKLDKCNKLPATVIDSSSLGLIPRSHPEELNNISL